jgi:hypothetical protein
MVTFILTSALKMPYFRDLGKKDSFSLCNVFYVATLDSFIQISFNSRTAKGVEYLVEASAAEAEAISAALAAAKARQENGEVELPDRDRGAEATPSGKHTSSLIKSDPVANNIASGGVRLHHRAVGDTF